MRRIASIATTLLLALPILSGTAAAATTATAATCTGTIDITQLAFSPASIKPGQSTALNLTAVNCTDHAVTTSLVSYGRFMLPGSSSIPPGCPAVDPLSQPVTFPPNGSYSASLDMVTFASCTATAYQGIVRFDSSGGTLASGTAQLTIVQPVPPVACHVTYTVQSQWNGGFIAAISITNTGTIADNGWTLDFTFSSGQTVVVPWESIVVQTGGSVSLSNMSYDATISPGSTLSIGFQGSWTSTNPAPSSFTLNGTPCT